ncbi:glycosyl hydrolases family 43 protein [Elsinoe australis]|uniref:Arabinan endo-1,5-alpha-L-arabinosidase n=1 Tax=Elsinoe australis TaxID=40998 RepID=A0A4U7B1U6_9PEZI|nr:glycosyl hydrolases family 43 protein [Elsinoe australis]
MQFLNSVLLVVPALVALVQGYAMPMACSGICTNTHDPSLIRRSSDGKYFRFATGGRMPVFTAPALNGPWSQAGTVLQANAKVSGQNSDMWAPDVSQVGDTYYLIYSASSFGGQNSNLGLATSKTMEPGSWTDLGSIFSSKTGDRYNAIDGQLMNLNGGYVVNFGSFWQDLFQFNIDLTRPTLGKDGTTQLVYQPAGEHAIEAAYMVKRDNTFYLFFSAGKCCGLDKNRPAAGQEYSIRVCASSNYKGGFKDKNGVDCLKGGGTIVLPSHDNIYAPGGQGVYLDPKQGWLLYYHYIDTKVGYADGQKKLGINKLNWSGGWPSV